ALAAPFVAQYGWLMPVKAGPLPYLPGDLINLKSGTWKATGWYAICEPLRRVEGQYLVFAKHHYNPENEEVRIHTRHCELFHGLPGNRVNNPSQRHRLIREPGRIGYRYPGDAP